MNTAEFVVIIRTERLTEIEKVMLDRALEAFGRQHPLTVRSIALLQKVEGQL